MSSRFIPPKDGSISSTACTISTASRARMQSGTAPTPPNSLKRRALPSMTGKPASGPISDAILLAFFDRRHVAIAGVVDEHIDAAENPFGFGHDAPDLVSAGHVESESLRFRFIADDQIGDFVRIARRSDDTTPAPERRAGELSAQPTRAASDHPNGRVIHSVGHSTLAPPKSSPPQFRFGPQAQSRPLSNGAFMPFQEATHIDANHVAAPTPPQSAARAAIKSIGHRS